MKKFIFVCGAALLAAGLLVLAGCENGSSSPKSKGVLGQINGAVYDNVTLEPISGVSVQIGTKTARTNNNGYFTIANVSPGDYTVTFQKDGYRFYSQTAYIDPEAYKNDDPFLEADALYYQLEALRIWAAGELGNATADGSWTYQNGIWINDDTAVTVVNDNGQFKITPIKLEYTYNIALSQFVVPMTPLTGAIKGTVKLIKAQQTESLNIPWDEIINIPEGVELWFTDASGHSVFDPSDPAWTGPDGNPNPVTPVGLPDAWFGPFKTGRNGTFEASGLPAETDLILVFDNFSADGFFYSPNATYRWDGTALTAATDLSSRSHSGSRNFTDVGTLYLFAESDFTFVTAFAAGSAAAPVRTMNTVEVTFDEAISANGFSALLVSAGNPTFATIPLASEWNDSFTTVTLRPLVEGTGTGTTRIGRFPYSEDQTLPVGRLTFTGRAESGKRIYAGNGTVNGLPVYTEEGIKLIDIDYSDPAAASIARTTITAETITLYFNKDLSSNSRFVWQETANTTAQTPADFTIDGAVATVSTTNVLSTSAKTLRYNAVSAADEDDSTGFLSTDSFQKPASRLDLALISAGDLYDGKEAGLTLQETLNIGKGTYTFGTGSAAGGRPAAITFTFNQDIPDGAVIEAGLFRGNGTTTTAPTGFVFDPAPTTYMLVETAVSGADFTVTPYTRLEADSVYYLCFRFKSADGLTTYFDTSTVYNYREAILAWGNGITGGNNYYSIAFRTTVDTTLPAINVYMIPHYTATTITTSYTSDGINVAGGGLSATTDNLVAGIYYIQISNKMVGDFALEEATVDGITLTVAKVAYEDANLNMLQLTIAYAATVDDGDFAIFTLPQENSAGAKNANISSDITITITASK